MRQAVRVSCLRIAAAADAGSGEERRTQQRTAGGEQRSRLPARSLNGDFLGHIEVGHIVAIAFAFFFGA